MGTEEDEKDIVRGLFYDLSLSVDAIAKKRNEDVEKVREILEEINSFKKKGLMAAKEKDYIQASFWYLQHKHWVLRKENLSSYQLVKKKAKKSYPYFGDWLEKERIEGNLKEDTKWETVHKKYLSVASDLVDEAQNDHLEAELGVAGAYLMTVEEEEQILSAVCNISKDDSNLGDGILIKTNDIMGILLSDTKLKRREDCVEATLHFENTENEIKVLLESDMVKDFYINNDLKKAFFSFNNASFTTEHGLTPISSKKVEIKEEKEASCHSCFFMNREKFQTNCTIKSVEGNNYVLDKSIPAAGAPIFVGDVLAGFVIDKTNKAESVVRVWEWLNTKLRILEVQDKVHAKWTDGYYYPAIILEQTSKGYKVHFYEYGEEDENKIELPKDDIRIQEEGKVEDEKVEDEKVEDENKIELDEEKFKEVVQFLKNNNLGKHENTFRDNKWDNLQTLKQKANDGVLRSELNDILLHGTIVKVEKAIKNHPIGGVYKIIDELSSENEKIKEILNTPMVDDFKPSGSDIVLNDQFRVNGKISIRSSLQKIIEGEIKPRGVSKRHPEFYLRSTNQNRFFKIKIVYQD